MKYWTLITINGKERNFIEYTSLDQLNRALKKHGFLIECREGRDLNTNLK